MAPKTDELRKKIGSTFGEVNSLKDKVATEERQYTPEEDEQLTRMFADIDKWEAELKTEERNAEIDALDARVNKLTHPSVEPEKSEVGAEERSVSDLFGDFVSGADSMWEISNEQFAGVEKRALSTANVADAIADEPMGGITRAIHEYVDILRVARVARTPTGADYPLPTIVDTANTGRLEPEGGSRRTNQDPTVDQQVLKAYVRASDTILMSREAFQDFNGNAQREIGFDLGERVAAGVANWLAVGTGSSQPQGYVNGAANSGVSVGATDTAITYSELLDIELSLNLRLRRNATWMLSGTAFKAIRMINAGGMANSGDPIWQPNLREGAPGTILGYPYYEDPNIPEMGTSGNKFLVFGDMSRFRVRIVNGVSFRVYRERYADTGQYGFEADMRMDSRVVDPGGKGIVYAANG